MAKRWRVSRWIAASTSRHVHEAAPPDRPLSPAGAARGRCGDLHLPGRNASAAPRRVLKTLLPTLDVDPETLERFRREVTIQISLRHPNVWEVVDYGFWEGDTPYIVI